MKLHEKIIDRQENYIQFGNSTERKNITFN